MISSSVIQIHVKLKQILSIAKCVPLVPTFGSCVPSDVVNMMVSNPVYPVNVKKDAVNT
jgi:hypothetical protein